MMTEAASDCECAYNGDYWAFGSYKICNNWYVERTALVAEAGVKYI